MNKGTLRNLVIKSLILLSMLVGWGVNAGEAENLTILTEEWPPISFLDRDGTPNGLGVDVVEEILKRLNVAEKIKVYPWARAYNMLTTEPNVVLFTVTRTEEREQLFTMIGPVAIGALKLYAKKGRSLLINRLEDAQNVKNIGVTRSAVEEQLLLQAGFSNLEQVTIPLFSAKKLLAERIDLWMTSSLTVGNILKEAGYTHDDVEAVYTVKEDALFIAFSRGTHEATVARWKQALEEIKADGTFARLYAQWLPEEVPPAEVVQVGVLK